MSILAFASLLFSVPAVYAHNSPQIKTVGNPLSINLQQKPAVIQVKSRNCPMCRQMEPTLKQVKEKYKSRVTFITFDVSDGNSAQEAAKVAGAANLSSFFVQNRKNTGLIVAVDPRSGRVMEQFGHTTTIDDFSKVLDVAIADFGQK